MADFIQLAVKRRQTKRGFLDLLYKYRNDVRNRAMTGRQIKQTVQGWLIQDMGLHNPPRPEDRVEPFDILSAAFNRICEIAGHAWLEFVKEADDKHIRTGSDRPINYEDLHLAEFVPEPDYDLMFEVFATERGASMLWRKVTAAQIVELFAPMIDESQEHRQPTTESTRWVNGCVEGKLNYLSPDNRREFPKGWIEDLFKKETGDRHGAYVTPVWQVDISRQVIDVAHPFYSFTPEHYETTDNCITWASRVLDSLLSVDWLQEIREKCQMAHPYCRKRRKGVVRKACVDYHIREQGRVKCLDLYLGKADGARINGLTKFV